MSRSKPWNRSWALPPQSMRGSKRPGRRGEEAGRAGIRYAGAQSTLTAAEQRQQDAQRNLADIEQQLGDGWTGRAPSEAECDERIRSIRQADAELEEARAAHAEGKGGTGQRRDALRGTCKGHRGDRAADRGCTLIRGSRCRNRDDTEHRSGTQAPP